MTLGERRLHVIKQSDGTTWSFSYIENTGIVYRILEKSKWSSDYIITDKGTEKFSAVLLSDDRICILYQDTLGYINLSMYDGNEWSDQQILKNEQNDMLEVHFKVVTYKDEIHVIYNILNKETKITTLFHQIFDEKNNLSNPKIIDIIKFEYQIPFILCSEENKGIYVVYQRLISEHQIGYKIFNKESENWSDFYVIDTSSAPYKDYSMIIFKDSLNLVYIKCDQDIKSLIYAREDNANLKYNKLLEDANIDSCLLLILNDQIWCVWIQEEKICGSFSIDNGENFSIPPYAEQLTAASITKAKYNSNNTKNMKGILFNEIYIPNEEFLRCLIISDMYPNIDNNDDNYTSWTSYFMERIHEMMSICEKKFKQREQFVNQLKYILEEQKIKSLSYESKFEEINKEYSKFREGKELLNENVSYLQESLISKEQRLNELENLNIEKENEILCLREKIYQQESGTLTSVEEEITSIQQNINIEKDNEILNLKDEVSEQEHRILSLIEEIKNLKEQVGDLNSQLKVANSKLNSSFIKRIFNNE